MNALTQLRDLHAPTDEAARLRCDGCDFEPNYEGEPPEWPCRTAEIVYSDEEITDITSSHRWWTAWGRERDLRRRLATGWSATDDTNALLGRMAQRMIADLLRPSYLVDTQHAQITTNAVKYAQTVPISHEALARHHGPIEGANQ